MDSKWHIIASVGEVNITCNCGIYYDMEYTNLLKMQNHIKSMAPDARFTLTKRWPRLIARGRNVPSKEIIESIIIKNHDSFKHPATNRMPPTVEHIRRYW